MLAYTESSIMSSNNRPELQKEIINIKSRFGEISADPEKAIFFPKGIPGFPENLHFSLVGFPTLRPDLEQFKILQCLNDHSISFPVLPIGLDNKFFEKEDMEECLKTVEVKRNDFAMLLIVSSTKQPDGSFRLFVNTKAPIVIDTSLQMAIQYVFTNNKYNIREELKS